MEFGTINVQICIMKKNVLLIIFIINKVDYHNYYQLSSLTINYYCRIFILIINSSTQNTVMLICLPSVKKKRPTLPRHTFRARSKMGAVSWISLGHVSHHKETSTG